MAANVYTSLSNAVVYTDKLRISTKSNEVTYQVYATGLGSKAPVGNLYSVPFQIPADSIVDVYCGAGNNVTIVGSNWTALELGTASSAQAGVIGGGS